MLPSLLGKAIVLLVLYQEFCSSVEYVCTYGVQYCSLYWTVCLRSYSCVETQCFWGRNEV